MAAAAFDELTQRHRQLTCGMNLALARGVHLAVVEGPTHARSGM